MRRTGYRKPKKHLKVWGDSDWTKRLTPRLHVSMIDEELPVSEQRVSRKSWYLGLSQPASVAKTLGSIRGMPRAGASVVLFEDDVLALVEHVLTAELVVLDGHSILNGPELEADPKIWARDARILKAQARRKKKR